MITVKCGYEGCDWKLEVPTMYVVQTSDSNEYPLDYITHVARVHEKLIPAIWER